MNFKEYQKLGELEGWYWWYTGRRHIIRTVLEKYFKKSVGRREALILDAGCGTGGNGKLLNEFGSVIGMDPFLPKDLRPDERQGFAQFVAADVANNPFPDNHFDCITLLDVLEHIDDAELALKECFRVLKPEGKMLITVPACQWLWSGHDEALGHKRRYTARTLGIEVGKSGLDIKFKSYVITFLFPLIAGYRLLEKTFQHKQKTSHVIVPVWVNNIFVQLLRLESELIRRGIYLPFGSSVIILAQKPKTIP